MKSGILFLAALFMLSFSMQAQSSEKKMEDEQKVKEIQQLRNEQVTKSKPMVNTHGKEVEVAPDQPKTISSENQIKETPARRAISTGGVQKQQTTPSEEDAQPKEVPQQKTKQVEREVQKKSDRDE